MGAARGAGIVGLALLASACASSSSHTSGFVTARDVIGLSTEGGARLSSQDYPLAWAPDGQALFAAVPAGVLNGSRSSIWVFHPNGRAGRQIAEGRFLDPSPNGRYAILVRNDNALVLGRLHNDQFEPLREISPAIGDDVVLTRSEFRFSWSPDSRYVAVLSVSAVVGDRPSGGHWSWPTVTSLSLVSVEGATTQPFSSERPIAQVAWSNDGRSLFLSRGEFGRQDDGTTRASASLVEIDLNGTVLSTRSDLTFYASAISPTPEPNGRRIAVALDTLNISPISAGLSLAVLDGVHATPVIAAERLWGGFEWAPSGGVLWSRCQRGAIVDALCGYDVVNGSRSQIPLRPLEFVNAFSIAPTGQSVAWSSIDLLGTFRVNMSRLEGGDTETLVELRAIQPRQNRASRIAEVEWNSGEITLRGLLVRPRCYVAGQSYPLIVDIHGGPGGGIPSQGALFLGSPLEWQMWSDLGYSVFVADYRESGVLGTDPTFLRRPTDRALLDGDVDDILAGIDHLAALGIADRTRVGVVGHSHGATIANWLLVSRPESVTAVFSKDGVLDWTPLEPFARDFYSWYFNAPAADLHGVMAANSPIGLAGSVRRPFRLVTVAHGTDPAIAEAFVTRARANGIDAAIVNLAGEQHAPVEIESLDRLARESAAFLGAYLRPSAICTN